MAEPVRVLHVFGKLDKGGAESRTMDIYRTIDRSRVQFDFIVHHQEQGFFEAEIKTLGGRVFHKIPRFKVFNIVKYMKAWSLFLEEHEFSCIHIHMTTVAAPVLCMANKYGIKMRVCHAQSSSEIGFSRKLITFLSRPWMKKLATYRFAVSDIAGKFAYGEGYSIVRDAIDLESFRYNDIIRAKMRKMFGIEKNFVIGHIGRFHKVKNHQFILNVFANSLKKIPNALLILVGDGELRNDIETKIGQMNISDKVLLLGIRDDVQDLLQTFDLLVLSSLFEGLPGVAIEAQATGLPCILSETITPEAQVIDGLVSYQPIDKGVYPWLEEIRQIAENPPSRRDTYEDMKRAGFDVKDAVVWFERFYTEAK